MLLLSLFAVVEKKKKDPADEKSAQTGNNVGQGLVTFDRWPLLPAMSLDEWGHLTCGLTVCADAQCCLARTGRTAWRLRGDFSYERSAHF